MWGNWGRGERASKIDAVVGWHNLKNVDWRDPFEVLGTLVYLVLVVTAIVWVPVCILTGPGGWVIGAALWVLAGELAPPHRPWEELDQQGPASELGRTPEVLYEERLARIRSEQAEEAARRQRGSHLW